jgi:mRNA interferase HigB
MRILSKRALREFWQSDQNAERPLRYWYSVTEKASWSNFSDVRNDFRTADVFRSCTVFDVGGNKYRLIAKIDYRFKTVFVRAVMPHKDYDKGAWKDDCNR